jgi:hypothetical protein
MAPPVGVGDKGGLVERPTRPKPSVGVSAAPLQRRRAVLDADVTVDDGDFTEGLGLRQGKESQIGGIVDMEDEVYLEFDEEEEVKEVPTEHTSWRLMARYMANFKPNTKAMFKRFV